MKKLKFVLIVLAFISVCILRNALMDSGVTSFTSTFI